MRPSADYLFSYFMILVISASAVFAQEKLPLKAYPVKELRVPVELYEDGSEKVKLFAEGARQKRKDETQLAGVTIDFLLPNGVTNGTVYAENCIYHSNAKAVMSEHEVRMEKDGLVISGRGFEWKSDDETFEIVRDAAVSYSRPADDTGNMAESVIRSNRLTFDYYRNMALFEGRVKAKDPQVYLDADRLTVVFEGTNSIKSATADGNVSAKAAEGEASCSKAIYIGAESKVVLTGDVILTSGGITVQGRKVTAWLDENRVVSEPGTLTVPEGAKGVDGLLDMDAEPASEPGRN